MNSKNIWDNFDYVDYIRKNYSYIHDEDKQIIDILIPYLACIKVVNRAIDIGTGPNLYPVILILPYVKQVNCFEYSQNNINYLKQQFKKTDDIWKTFQRYFISKNKKYKFHLDKELAEKTKVRKGNIYNLRKNKYDLATMFFCVESITEKRSEFEKACLKFVNCVRKGGHLIAVFMSQSQRYKVGKTYYRAYSVTEKEIFKLFKDKTTDLKVYFIKKGEIPLRKGYNGLILITAKG